MRSIVKFMLPIALFFTVLTGCSTYGVSNDQWNHMTPAERQHAMKNYYRNQAEVQRQQAESERIKAQNAPLISAIGSVINNAIPENKRRKEHCTTERSGNTVKKICKSVSYGFH